MVVKEHVKALDYGLMDLAVISCKHARMNVLPLFSSCSSILTFSFSCCFFTGWGESERLDRARITQLMEETVRQNSPLKWTVYYEDEEANDFSVDAIVQDLNYLKTWFA